MKFKLIEENIKICKDSNILRLPIKVNGILNNLNKL